MKYRSRSGWVVVALFLGAMISRASVEAAVSSPPVGAGMSQVDPEILCIGTMSSELTGLYTIKYVLPQVASDQMHSKQKLIEQQIQAAIAKAPPEKQKEMQEALEQFRQTQAKNDSNIAAQKADIASGKATYAFSKNLDSKIVQETTEASKQAKTLAPQQKKAVVDALARKLKPSYEADPVASKFLGNCTGVVREMMKACSGYKDGSVEANRCGVPYFMKYMQAYQPYLDRLSGK